MGFQYTQFNYKGVSHTNNNECVNIVFGDLRFNFIKLIFM